MGRVKLNCLIVVQDGGCVLFEGVFGIAPIVVGVSIVRVKLDCLTVSRNRLIARAFLQEIANGKPSTGSNFVINSVHQLCNGTPFFHGLFFFAFFLQQISIGNGFVYRGHIGGSLSLRHGFFRLLILGRVVRKLTGYLPNSL